MPLTTPDEVAGVLNLSPTPPAPWAESAIAVAESWARRWLGISGLGEAGDVVTSAHDVRSDGFVYAPGPVAKVEVVWGADEAPEELGAGDWTAEADGVRLRTPGESQPWPHGYGEPLDPGPPPHTYVRVDVTSEGSADVDPLVAQGVALAAAAVLTRSPRLAKGLTGERIGDYSYTVAPLLTGDPFFEQAKAMMRPLKQGGNVRAT